MYDEKTPEKTLRIESESLVDSVAVEVLRDLTLKLILPVKMWKLDDVSLWQHKQEKGHILLTKRYVTVVCATNKLTIHTVPAWWKRIVARRPIFHCLRATAQNCETADEVKTRLKFFLIDYFRLKTDADWIWKAPGTKLKFYDIIAKHCASEHVQQELF